MTNYNIVSSMVKWYGSLPCNLGVQVEYLVEKSGSETTLNGKPPYVYVFRDLRTSPAIGQNTYQQQQQLQHNISDGGKSPNVSYRES